MTRSSPAVALPERYASAKGPVPATAAMPAQVTSEDQLEPEGHVFCVRGSDDAPPTNAFGDSMAVGRMNESSWRSG